MKRAKTDMFTSKSWAMAFINSLEKEDGDSKNPIADIEDGVNTFMALASWASSLQGVIFGRTIAEKMEPLLRQGVTATGTLSQTQEIAIRFFLLIVRKNAIRHIGSIIKEIKKGLNKRHGVIAVSAEYTHKPKEEFEFRVIEAIKKRTGAAKVELTGIVNPELIGGYRLRIGDEIIDASICYQLQRMEACLAAGLTTFSK